MSYLYIGEFNPSDFRAIYVGDSQTLEELLKRSRRISTLKRLYQFADAPHNPEELRHVLNGLLRSLSDVTPLIDEIVFLYGGERQS